VVPEVLANQVFDQLLVQAHELATQHSAHLEVAREGFEHLVVAEHLAGAGGWHGRHEQRVARAVLHHLSPQLGEVLLLRLRVELLVVEFGPHVETEQSFREGAAFEGAVPALGFSQFHAFTHGGVVNAFEYPPVGVDGCFLVEGNLHLGEEVSQPLDSDAHGPVLQVGVASLLDGLLVAVDDVVEVADHEAGDLVQFGLVDVVGLGQLEGRQTDARQVAHGHLLLVGLLDDFGTEVAALYHAQVLLVGLAVRVVLVEHLGGAGLDLTVNYHLLQLQGVHGLAAPGFRLVLDLKLFKLRPLAFRQALGFIRTEERPLAFLHDTLHKQVRDPQRLKEVSGAFFVFPDVSTHFEELLDVGMPGLDVHGDCAFAFASALVDLASSLVKHAQHRQQP